MSEVPIKQEGPALSSRKGNPRRKPRANNVQQTAAASSETVIQSETNKAQATNEANESRVKKPVSNPEVELKFTLQSKEAMGLLTRNFFQMSQNLFRIFLNSRRLERLGQKNIVRDTKASLIAMLDSPLKDLRVGITAYSSMLEEAGNIGKVSHTHPQDFEVKVRTPETTKLARLIMLYDEICVMLDEAYLNALVDESDIAATKDLHHDRLVELGEKINSLSEASFEQVKKLSGSVASESLEENKAQD